MLDSYPEEKFQQLMRKLELQSIYLQAIKQGASKYSIRPYNIDKLSPEKVRQLYYSLSNKSNKDTANNSTLNWAQNQLRLYLWVLVGYSFVNSKPIKQMGLQDWKYFTLMFRKQNQLLFEFQGRSILKNQYKLTKWEKQETLILSQIINSRCYKKKWNQIAKELFIRSNKRYFRIGKQCRQHWLNHLDPVKIHTPWTKTQDQILITHVLQYGKKWSNIVKALNGKRTQHMVKNRFKSLFNFESKNNTQMREIDIIKIIKDKLQNNIDIKSSCLKRKKKYPTQTTKSIGSAEFSEQSLKEQKQNSQLSYEEKNHRGQTKLQNTLQDIKKVQPIQQQIEKSPSIFWNFGQGNQQNLNHRIPTFIMNQNWDMDFNYQDLIVLGNVAQANFDKY